MSDPAQPTPNLSGDYLGYGVYADTLWARIARALDKDADGHTPLGDDPLVVGIFGEWGAGKSKLLSLIQQRALDRKKSDIARRSGEQGEGGDAAIELTIPVFFQPWKYEHEKHLLVPLMLHIVAELEATLEKATTAGEEFNGVVQKAGDKLVGTMRGLVDGFGKLYKSVQAAHTVAEPASATALMVVAKFLLKFLGEAKKLVTPANQFAFKDDGRSYYDMHAVLKKLTRPGGVDAVKGAAHMSKSSRINFVVFIDDLDRCLPEKAVEALELIKTVFNLESFAFVLALDEEVVERGIGHRYRDYNFKGKKPEMPITGFEYLEKIVHLPFRLPALTLHQAKDFVCRYERQVESDAGKRWFTPLSDLPAQADGHSNAEAIVEGKAGHALGREAMRAGADANLLDFALSSFDAYVPRKLIRMVELVHQVAEVAKARNRPISRYLGGPLDARVIVALLLVQLFQPELYRIMRRKVQAFPFLLAAFANRADTTRIFTEASMADVDLWVWVAPGAGSEVSAVRPANATALDDATACIAGIKDPAERARAQQVRLPIVVQLVEHRSAQRHVFDVLKLMRALALDMEKQGGLAPTDLVFDDYRCLLTEDVAPAAPDTRQRYTVRDVQKLFADLVAEQPEVQANLAANNDLPAGQVLSAESAAALLALCAAHDKKNLHTLSNGLRYLAPYLAREDGIKFWNLVASSHSEVKKMGEKFADIKAIALREAAADLRSTLGADNRFDPAFFYLPKQPFPGHTKQQEPIPGFVHIPKGKFMAGFEGERDKQPRELNVARDFFLARYLTTVDQYACFVDAKGYENDALWDKTGWDWRTGNWDSKIKEKSYREGVTSRTVALRQQPMHWAEQRAHGSRPVWGVSWFEARAYVRWLQGQRPFQNRLQENQLGQYEAMLPTEAQWERAAKASSHTETDAREYPWGGDAQDTAHLHANIQFTEIERPSVVGLFSASTVGLYDISGNLWEWQDNLSTDLPRQSVFPRVAADHVWITDGGWKNSDMPALCGGAWNYPAYFARASASYSAQPGGWFIYVGFRVVLSLALEA